MAGLNIFEMINRITDAKSYAEESSAYIESLFKSVGTKEKSKKRLQIEAAVNYINTHYAERITLDDLAELCELSTYISANFSKAK